MKYKIKKEFFPFSHFTPPISEKFLAMAVPRAEAAKKETARLATCGGEVSYGNFAVGEYTLALRLESELSDLRAGYANPCACKQTLLRFRARNRQKKNRTSCDVRQGSVLREFRRWEREPMKKARL